jgi:hypothetical protein
VGEEGPILAVECVNIAENYTISPEHLALLKSVHNHILGHRGIQQTIDIMKSMGLQWRHMRRDIIVYIHACPSCQAGRLKRTEATKQNGVIQTFEPFISISVDHEGPFPTDKYGNTYLCNFIDDFSKYVEPVPCMDTSAKETARCYMSVFGRYGICQFIRSDNGSAFVNETIKHLTALLHITPKYAIAYRAQSNGIIERANAEITRHLRVLCMEFNASGEWSDYLP